MDLSIRSRRWPEITCRSYGWRAIPLDVWISRSYWILKYYLKLDDDEKVSKTERARQ